MCSINRNKFSSYFQMLLLFLSEIVAIYTNCAVLKNLISNKYFKGFLEQTRNSIRIYDTNKNLTNVWTVFNFHAESETLNLYNVLKLHFKSSLHKEYVIKNQRKTDTIFSCHDSSNINATSGQL